MNGWEIAAIVVGAVVVAASIFKAFEQKNSWFLLYPLVFSVGMAILIISVILHYYIFLYIAIPVVGLVLIWKAAMTVSPTVDAVTRNFLGNTTRTKHTKTKFY